MLDFNIAEGKLLRGSHSDTAVTGQGCFMNVIAYLNGEDVITDNSPCVCVTVRPIAVFANDFMNNKERTALAPYIMRALGSATKDPQIIKSRLVHVIEFANKMREITKLLAVYAKAAVFSEYSGYAAKCAARYAENAENAENAAKCAAWSAENAENASEHASQNSFKAVVECAFARREIIDACLLFLDRTLPHISEIDNDVLCRAKEFMEIA